MMHDFWNMGWGGGMWFGPIIMIALPILVIALIVWLVRSLSSRGSPTGSADRTPNEILDERFARGEIDEQDYERRRKMLGP